MAGILSVQIKSVNDKNVNFKKVEHFIKHSNKSLDLVVLPELFYTNEYQSNIEPEDGGDSILFIKELAKKYNTNIISGAIIRKCNDKIFSSSFAINRKGQVIKTYNKKHLNNYYGNNESSLLSAGNELAIAEFDFAKIGMAIGFDIRFPELFTKLIKKNIDIITIPTAWSIPIEIYENKTLFETAQKMWESICKTRAYDNGIFFVVSNQVKEFTTQQYGLGYSMIISPTAQILANAYDKECAVYANVDISLIQYLRQVFPINSID